jgi:hypothetical protein
MNKYLLRRVKDVPSTLDAAMNDALAELEDQPVIGFTDKLPNVSVGSKTQPRDVIKVKFLESAPQIKTGKDKFGKDKQYAWIKVEMLSPHAGYKDGANIQLAKGDQASINLFRHANLKSWSAGIGDLMNRTFIIGTLAIVQTAKGNNAMDYRVKEVTGE